MAFFVWGEILLSVWDRYIGEYVESKMHSKVALKYFGSTQQLLVLIAGETLIRNAKNHRAVTSLLNDMGSNQE